MSRRRLIALFALAAVLLTTTLSPRRASAGSDSITTPLIISGAVLGAITVVTIVAVLLAGDEEPHFLAGSPAGPLTNHAANRERLRFGLQCRTPDGTPALACW